jgi:hypothetical protein
LVPADQQGVTMSRMYQGHAMPAVTQDNACYSS